MKKLLHFLILILITLCFNGCFWGWGWLMPYAFQPSFKEFKEMCELNELPNSEEKYNKILSYFDKKLGDIDDFPHTKEYSKRIREITLHVFYYQYYNEYDHTTLEGKLAIGGMANKPPKEKYRLDFDKIHAMTLWPTWHTKRFRLDGNEGSGLYWDETELKCSDIDLKRKK